VAGAADGDDGWWVTDPVRVTVTATDASGVESVATSVDSSSWATTSGATTSALVSGDGTHTVRARAADMTGNQSTVESLQVRIDATDPVSRATVDTDRLVTVRAADATSGVRRIETSVDTGAWTAYAGPFAAGSARSVRYRAVDRAGNVEPAHTVALPAPGAELAATSIAASAPGTTRVGAPSSVSIRVASTMGVPSGSVRIVSGDRLIASGQLVDGRVRLSIDTASLGVGTHVLKVRYDGDTRRAAAGTTVSLQVAKAGSTTTVRVVRSSDGQRATARVRVVTDPAGQAPERVRAVLTRNAKVLRSTWLDLSDAGRARWSVRPRRPGTYVVRVVARGSELVEGSTDSGRVRLR